MNAKIYYSSLIEPSPSSSLNLDEDNYNDRIKHSMVNSRSSSSCFDNNIPSLFYRIGSVGQDNRLCFWDITEDVLKINKFPSNSNTNTTKKNPSNSPVNSTVSNGYSSFLSDITPITSTNSAVSTTKSSFSSLTSRLSFTRNSNKVHKSIDDTPDNSLVTLSNGSAKKNRKVSALSQTLATGKSSPTSTLSNDSVQGSLSTLTNPNTQSSRRTNFDLTKTVFGTSLCPRLDQIQVIEPIITELISHERLNGIHFGENSLIISSQDGVITIWEKPQRILLNNAVGSLGKIFQPISSTFSGR